MADTLQKDVANFDLILPILFHTIVVNGESSREEGKAHEEKNWFCNMHTFYTINLDASSRSAGCGGTYPVVRVPRDRCD